LCGCMDPFTLLSSIDAPAFPGPSREGVGDGREWFPSWSYKTSTDCTHSSLIDQSINQSIEPPLGRHSGNPKPSSCQNPTATCSRASSHSRLRCCFTHFCSKALSADRSKTRPHLRDHSLWVCFVGFIHVRLLTHTHVCTHSSDNF